MFNAANTNRKRPFKAVAGASSSASSSKNKGNGNNNTNTNAGIGGNTSNIKEKNFSTPPTTIEINGIEVHFPFKPYDVQRDYMTGVLTALQNGQHALLESPTGTGKTLCLLCSALAWQRQEKGRIAMTKMDQQQQHPSQLPVKQQSMVEPTDQNNGGIIDAANVDSSSSTTSNNKHPVIIYASRTHSQLSQVVNELRNTRYRPRHAVLGSREHMCIHPKVNPSVANKGRSNKSTSSGSDFYSSDTPALSSEFTSSSPMDVNNGCNKLNKERKCMYRNNLDDKSAAVPVEGYSTAAGGGGSYEQPVMDMEDLVTFGKLNKVCPFYHTRSLLKDAELLFVPYNYLFDRDARESSLAEIDFQNSILIFDEAHNLEEFASESASFDLGSGDLAGCVGEVQRALQYMEVNGPENDGMTTGGLSKQNVIHLKSVLLRFEKYLMESMDINGGGGDSSSHPGEYIFDIFQRGAGINHDNLQIFINFVKQVGDFVLDFKGGNNSSRNASSGTPKLDHFLNCLKRAFGSGSHLLALARAKSYRVHVTKIAGGGGYSGGRTISFWCFAPALAMRELTFLKVRSIIITSGTLSPLPSFSMELGLKFPVQLENDHVILPDQIFVRVIGKGVSGKELTSKFGRRDDPEYILELGNTLASLCNNIPGGVLVFFPSYVAMEAAIQRWGGPSSERNNARQSGRGAGRGAAFFAAAKRKVASAKYVFPLVPNHFRATTTESSPWQRLLARKSIVLEPRSTSELNDAISEYKKFIGTPKSTGAILMGVCRGKISEGIDFSDDMCRAVIVTGLPFAPYLDPKVRLKREFLDAARASAKARPSIDGGFGNGKMPDNTDKEATSKTLSGAEWYNQQAHRAVNQAIGRVIRHRHDYGAVLLLDHRFAEVRNKEGLSKWLRPHLRDETIGASTRGLVQFYRESKIKAEMYKEVSQQPKLNERPVIKYEQNGEVENIVSKVTVVHKGEAIEDTLSNGYVPENLLLEKYDLNNLNSPPPQVNTPIVVDQSVVVDCGMVASISERPCAGLGAMYNKANQIGLLARPSQEAHKSSFEGVDCDFGDSTRPILNEKVKSRPQPRGNKDTATRHAKMFFEKAKDALDKDDILKLNKLLVTMKMYGDEKNEQQYIKAAKELMAVLVDSQVNTTRIQLISSLFPLLPIKYRYKFEKMAAALVFDNSPLTIQCKDLLREDELSSIRNHVLPLIFKEAAANDYVSDRAYLEDTQKILTVMVANKVNLQYLYELLPERQLMKVRALAIEMERSRDIANAKARSACFKGEVCVNSALFQPADKLPAVACVDPSLSEDVESQRMMSQALTQGLDVNRQRIDRVREIQVKTSSTATHFNPYQRTALKESKQKNQLSARSTNNHADISRKKNGERPVSRSNLKTHLDIVDECLNQVKSDCFVEPISKLERINGKIKSHVPKGMTCMVCNETLDQPLMSESCRHSACFHCWRTWLQRSNTCPTCRAPTTMNDLSKLVFTSETGAGAPTLTQICASDNEEESDEEELVIVPN